MTLAHIRAATAAFSSHPGTASPDVRADDAALDAIATVRAEQRSEALLLYLILTEKTPTRRAQGSSGVFASSSTRSPLRVTGW
jgi:hypothetical protein